MLRVGLTGGLGTGKSTVGQMLRNHGAHVIEADELGRSLMEPDQSAYNEIVRLFGPEVVSADGRLNRPRLAELAFKGNRLGELNAIIHPAVIEAQRAWTDQLFARDPAAVAVVVSALIFEVERDARASGNSSPLLREFRNRFDRIVLVTAPDDLKISRYIARTGQDRKRSEADARARLAHQISDAEKIQRSDYVLENTGDLASLSAQVERLWPRLKQESNLKAAPESLK